MARTSILHRLPLGRVHAGMPEWLRVALALVTLVLGAVIVIRPTTALDVLALLLGGGMVLTGVVEATSVPRRAPVAGGATSWRPAGSAWGSSCCCGPR